MFSVGERFSRQRTPPRPATDRGCSRVRVHRTFDTREMVSAVSSGFTPLGPSEGLTHLAVHEARSPQPGAFGHDDAVYQRLLRERIIFLGSEVRDDMANAICAQMLLLAAEDPDKDIFLYINSPGGSVSAGMAIYDTMQFVQNDVATVAMGLAASM